MTTPTTPYDAPPTLDRVRQWTGVSDRACADEDLQMVIDAEVQSQADACRVDPYSANLYAAVMRRCARQLAARGIPLGMTPPDAEFGPATLATFDAEVERLEGSRRKAVFG